MSAVADVGAMGRPACATPARGSRKRVGAEGVDKVSAVVAVDVTGRVIYVNAAVESFSGLARHALLDQPLSRVFGLDRPGAGRIGATVARRAMSGNRWTWLLEDGSLSSGGAPLQAMEFHAEPIRERDGSVTGAVLVFCQVGD